MRKFYSLFIALLAVCGLAQAQTTFTAGVDAAASDDDRTFTKGDITLTITDGRLNTEQYRVYKSQTLTITSAGKKITAIKFTCTANGTAKYGPGSFDAQDGYTFEPEGKIGMWQGEATSVSFTAGSNQVRATEIVVAVEGETIDGDVPGPGPDPQPTDEWKSSAESPVTVAKALELIGTLENGAKSTVEVYVKGKIATITEVSAQYGNATYTIVDDGSDAALTVFRGKYFNGENFTAEDQIKVGDEVVVVGLLQKYVKDEVVTPEVAQGNKIYSLNGQTGGDTPGPQPSDIDWTSSATAPLTVAAVLEKAAKLEAGQSSDKEVYVKGTISSIRYTFSAQYGTATFSISDNGQSENEFLCYGTYYLGNRAWVDGDDQIEESDEVIVYGIVTNYNGTLEMASKKNCLYSLNGKTAGGDTPGPQPGDEWQSSADSPVTVAKALELIGTLENGAKSTVEVYVKGKIATITEVSAQYGNATYTIVDDGSDAALTVFRGKYFNGENFTAEDQIKVGDVVVVVGLLQKYVKDDVVTPEVAQGNKIYSLNGKTAGGDTPDPGVTTYTKIADMQAAAQGLGTEKVPVKFSFTEAIVLGVKSKNIYITAGGRGLLLYGTNSKNLKAGDVISGAITGELQLYNGVTELGNANFDNVSLLDIAIVATPVKATIADISNAATKLAYESMLVTIKDVNIVVEEGTVKAIDDSDNEVVLFDNYNFGLAELGFLATETYNVTAIVGNYRGTIQLYPRSKEDIDGTFDEPQTYELEGDGSLEKPYTIADVLHIGGEKENGPKGWVRGFIVGYVNGQSFATGCIFSADAPEGTDNEENPLTVSNTNIILAASADVTDPAQCVPVQLANKYGMREALSLKDVPANLGKEVWIQGECIKYFSVAGVKNIEDWSFDGQTLTTAIKAVRTADAATIYNLNGQRVKTADKAGIYVVNGQKMVLK